MAGPFNESVPMMCCGEGPVPASSNENWSGAWMKLGNNRCQSGAPSQATTRMPSASKAHFAVGWFMNRRAVSSRKLNCLTPIESASSTPAPEPTGISVSPASWRLSSIGDPRVDVGVGDVGEQVEQNDQNGGDRQDAHQE